jgi:hypothetical protein
MPVPLDCCPIREQAKADRLDQLYIDDGRHLAGHPMRGLYTCLHIAALEAQQDPFDE